MSVAPADVRAAIVASLAAALPGLDIAAHGGNFSEAELQRFSIRAPAIRVCMTEISKIDYAVTVTPTTPNTTSGSGSAAASTA